MGPISQLWRINWAKLWLASVGEHFATFCVTLLRVDLKRYEYFGFQDYNDALEILISKVGELHPYVNRSYQNLGIFYEETRQYEKAFDYFFKRCNVARDLYGENHPLYVPAVETVYEPFYARLAKKLGVTLPPKPWNNGDTVYCVQSLSVSGIR